MHATCVDSKSTHTIRLWKLKWDAIDTAFWARRRTVIALYTLHTLGRAKPLYVCSSSSSSSSSSNEQPAAKVLKGATQDACSSKSSSSSEEKSSDHQVEQYEALSEAMLRLFKLPHEALFRKIVCYL
jgi:hypothetical protein